MVHTLRLDNYYPTPRKLVLGTNSSFGTESIKIERGAGWDGLNLTATWHIPGREEPLRVALLDGDAMDVPPEVTKEAKDGVLVLAGLASGVQRASCNVEYLILEQAGVYGGVDAEPTPELAAQVLEAVQDARDAAKDADQRATNAEGVANSVRGTPTTGNLSAQSARRGLLGRKARRVSRARRATPESAAPKVSRAFRVYKARRAIPASRGLLAKLARLAPRVILARRVSAVSRGRRERLARRGLPERTAYRLMMRR